MRKALYIFPLLIFVITIMLCSCTKQNNYEINRYPRGITEVDMTSPSPCFVDTCSLERIVRLRANDVKGVIRKRTIADDTYEITFTLGIDSRYTFIFCDLPEEYKIDNLHIRYSGDLIDACGIYNESWIIEEFYLLRLTDISWR